VRKIGLALIVLGASAARAEALNLYEWLGVAPIVVIGREAGLDGRYVLLRAESYLRGPQAAELLRIDLRQANLERNPEANPRPLRLTEGGAYVALLQPAHGRRHEETTVYRLVRGVHGVREVPGEGRAAFVEALNRCVAIQAHADDREVWALLHELLNETNPLLVDVALDQHLKFGRGEPALLGSVLNLLDHPDPGFRERAARLAGQIAAGSGSALPDPSPVRGALVARARKDGSIPVRVAATEALSGFEGEPVESILHEISRDDPDQAVRYAAEKLLRERRSRAPD
jgi:hypothetical protein